MIFMVLILKQNQSFVYLIIYININHKAAFSVKDLLENRVLFRYSKKFSHPNVGPITFLLR